ncbi:MAG: hypothetical protein ABSF48_05045 [Thermodesulfobacteriota bacterium]|jgi:hypothetical protein
MLRPDRNSRNLLREGLLRFKSYGVNSDLIQIIQNPIINNPVYVLVAGLVEAVIFDVMKGLREVADIMGAKSEMLLPVLSSAFHL